MLIQFIRSYPPYRRPFLYPQPEDAPCHGDRDPLTQRLSFEGLKFQGRHHMFPTYRQMTCHIIITWLLTNIFMTFSQRCQFLKLSLPFAFYNQIYMHLSLQSCVSYMTRLSNPSSFTHRNIWWGVITTKLVTLPSSPAPCHIWTVLSSLFLSTPV